MLLIVSSLRRKHKLDVGLSCPLSWPCSEWVCWGIITLMLQLTCTFGIWLSMVVR
uniref:Uncharacterized protein n=1 Tax=Rhizophora mucronata TaxID=61149 RepID=A0A2P2PQU6_RHIMU